MIRTPSLSGRCPGETREEAGESFQLAWVWLKTCEKYERHQRGGGQRGIYPTRCIIHDSSRGEYLSQKNLELAIGQFEAF